MRDSPDMSESKPFASLKPTLLARKGGAKPAMRPQLHPIHQLKETAPFAFEDDDLGWNDHGEADQEELHPAVQAALSDASADVLPLKSAGRGKKRDKRAATGGRSAAPRGRRVAFTLRLDAERHLKLRLASTVDGHSAQQIVTEALDRLIDEMPEIEALASRLNKRG